MSAAANVDWGRKLHWDGHLWARPGIPAGAPELVPIVREFQGDNGLVVDGICGPKTFRAALEARVRELNDRIPALLYGYGIWHFMLARADAAKIRAIVQQAEDYQLRRLALKIGQGTHAYHPTTGPKWAAACRDVGIRPVGWHWPTGADPEAEADTAVRAVELMKLDGIFINAEKHHLARKLLPSQSWFKATPGQQRVAFERQSERAERYVGRLRERLGEDFVLALVTFPLARYAVDFPYKAFMARCSAYMPECYPYRRDPLQHLEDAFADGIQFGQPIVPLLAFNVRGTGGPERLAAQLRACHARWALPGVDLYVWHAAEPQMWNVICPDGRPALGGRENAAPQHAATRNLAAWRRMQSDFPEDV